MGMTEHNLKPLVEEAFGERAKDLWDVWDQNYCTARDGAKYGMQKPLLRKDLKWMRELPKKYAMFYPDHVLLVDDDPLKCKKNPAGTAIHPVSFDEYRSDDRELLRMSRYFDALMSSGTTTVPEFVLANPYADFTGESSTISTADLQGNNMVEVW